ncbi:hypothetical protein CK203_053230 [Vitis vinifera]|uniref:Uncharacterized protein n=1 Tax=Vitis vinifera TaxID=29760 RepID=A0A438GJX8_VITVI|nr:hypothetical protein CK203_053230 [Vitis vinifera]
MPSPTFVKEITIREPELPALPYISSGSGRIAGLNHSGPSVPVAGRLALLAEEATSVNQPGSLHSNGPATRRFRPARDLNSGLIGALGLFSGSHRSQLLIRPGDHPEGSETEMAEANPTAPVVVPDGSSPGENQPTENDGAPDPGEESLPNASSGGVPLMMQFASPLVLSAMRSWERY